MPTQHSELSKLGLVEVGSAKFTIMFWDIYDSRLYTSTGKYPVQLESEKLVFEITYLKDIDKDDLIERTAEQWQHIGVNEEVFRKYLPSLKDIWPDIKAGDSLSLLVEGEQSYFYFNQQLIGSLAHQDFGQQFIDIWLSTKTSQPQLRAQLLKGNDL